MYSETDFRNVLKSHPAVMLLIDAGTGNIIEANQSAANFYGWSRKELIQKNFGEIESPTSSGATTDAPRSGDAGQKIFSTYHRMADGSIRDVEIFSNTIDLQGKAVVYSIIHDMSERKHFEALTDFRLRLLEMAGSSSTEELLSFTLDEAERLTGSSIGFFNFVSDDQTTILRQACSSNSKLDKCGAALHPTKIKSRVCADVVRQKAAVFHNDYSTLRHCNIETVEHLEVGRELIVPLIRNGLVMATLEIGNKPTDYNAGDIKLVSILVGVAWDIISKKYAEESEQKMQEVIQHTQKMELIGQLAGGIAHDINNMLMAILGNAELVLDEMERADPFAESLENIRTASVRAADMIHQLLAFARKQATQPRILALDAALGELFPMLESLVDEQITFEFHPGSSQAELLIDPSQLDQIVTNLCVNARDAIIGAGSVFIETSVIRVEQVDCYTGHACHTPGDYVMISVIDTGTGIDPGVRPHIFEPFFTTKEIGKGSGMGLSTIYGIVKQNNGYVECRSVPGKGSNFSIYLPEFKGNAESAPPSHEEGSAGSDERGGVILLVEDDPAMLEIIRPTLAANGYRVLTATSPYEAIRLASLSSRTVDLLLTNVIMPKMNGNDLSSKLRSICPDIKTLFMTAYVTDDMFDDDTHFIMKPFTLHKLSQTVQSILKISESCHQ
ncbi:MAG: GAF domain-containing protein [Chlorobiaceae bacterium]|nr:GAF domain-containing protein [Chlorobiaceae bacterium]